MKREEMGFDLYWCAKLKMKNSSLYYWLPVVIWISLIFLYSTPWGLIPSRQADKAISSSLALRNVLHMGGFAVLTGLLFRALRGDRIPDLGKVILWTVVASFGVALFCEIYQLLIPSRHFEWIDLIMDGMGVGGTGFFIYAAKTWKR